MHVASFSPSRLDARISSIYGVGCLAVVLGHATGRLPAAARAVAASDSAYASYLSLVEWLYSWHMPLFFVLAGVLYARSIEREGIPTWASFVQRRARRLLLPYLLVSTVAFPLKAALSHLALHPIDFSLQAYVRSLVLPWHNPVVYLWFLPTLFLVSIAGWCFLRRTRLLGYDAVLVCGCIVTWSIFEHRSMRGPLSVLNVGGALHNAVFYVGGFMIVRYLPIERIRAWPVALGALPLSLLLFIFVGADGWIGLPLAWIGVIAASATAVALRSAKLAWLGSHALPIYLLSWFFLVAVRVLLGQFLDANALLTVALSILAGIGGPVLLSISWRRWNGTRDRPKACQGRFE